MVEQMLLDLKQKRKPEDLKGQAARMRDFFRSRPGVWVPLPEILGLGIAQYNARIWDCRDAGMKIAEKEERVNGSRHTFYTYIKEQ
jgi:hypothetical protein